MLGVDPAAGLHPDEIGPRAAAAGPNELEPRKRESVLGMIVDSATEPFVLLLAAAGLAAILLNEIRDGILILIGLLPIVGADVVTEYRGERALDALRNASAPTARVRRGGAPMDVASGQTPDEIRAIKAFVAAEDRLAESTRRRVPAAWQAAPGPTARRRLARVIGGF